VSDGSRKPSQPGSLFSRAFRLFSSKLDPAAAAHREQQTPSGAPQVQAVHLDQARALKQQGQLAEALAICRRALALQPDDLEASLLLAEICVLQGDRAQAVALYSRIIELEPDQALAYYKRGNLLKDRAELESALADYDRAIALNPNYAHALCNRGVVLSGLNRPEAALESYDRAVAAAPDDALAFFNRAEVLRELRHWEEALASYGRAIAINPHYMESYFNRGVLLNELRRFAEALASLDQAVALKPDYPEAHLSRATALVGLRRYVAAIEAYEQVLKYKPDFRFVRGLHQHAKMLLCDWVDLDADVERIVVGIGRGEKISPPFPVLAIADDVSLHQKVAQIWVQEECPAKHDVPPFPERTTREKLHIAYLSGDLFDHPVAVLAAELFENHDRSRFETTAFSLAASPPSPMRQRLEKAFDRFVDVHDKSNDEVALLARSYDVDIAVDLSGHTDRGRPGILAQRAAPIQVGYLGYPGTWGAGYMDYLIGDPTVIPVEHQPHYNEKVIYLPHSFLPNDSTRAIDATPTREQAGLPPEGFVFCCFNNSYKITPEVFSSWMRILSRVEGSCLWLSQNNPTATSNLQQEAGRRGVDPNRLLFAQRTPTLPQHLARLRLCDVFLDTLPYNAHATAIDALWAGVPLLTRLGRSFAGRVAASLLAAIGLPELVTTSVQQYEDLAVELSTNPARLAEIRQRLASNRLSTPLFDSRSFVRHLETAYTRIYERHRAGLAPDHILVPY
jgi:protein O-GlcNAc transferase